MKLEWFRTHKNFVYWVLLPVVGGTMAFFGVTGKSGGSMWGHSSPRIMYKLGKTDHYLSSSEVLNLRTLYSKYIGRNANVGSVESGHYIYSYQQARAAGFEVGADEMKDDLRNAVKMQLRNREPSAPQVATDEVYEKLLGEMKMTAPEFEQLTHEIKVSAKYNQFEQTVQVNDNELFAEYCRQKQAVRLRYKQIKSADYLDKTKPAEDARIKDFYEKNKDNKIDMKDVLYTEAKLSGEVLGIDGEKYLASLKPTDIELKAMYDRMKPIKWVSPPDKKTADGFKPFDEVKAEVEKDWRDERKMQVGGELSKIQKELEEVRKDYVEVSKLWHPKEAESDMTPFDTVEWVKKKAPYLVYWTTDDLTEDQFAKGKKEFNAKDAGWMKDIFFWAHVPPNAAQYKQMFEERFNQFTSPMAVDPAKLEKGYVVVRKVKYTDISLKSLEESKAAIIERLKVLDAVDLAEKDAKQAREDWDGGKNLPKIDDMDEFIADSTTRNSNPLSNSFFGSGNKSASPKPIGEVLPVESAPPEATADKPNKQPHKNFYVGFAVEFRLPKYADYEKDTVWDREQHRRELEQSYSYSLMDTMRQQVVGATYKIPSDMQDPPLNDAYEHGD
jgi:hypothetical protein